MKRFIYYIAITHLFIVSARAQQLTTETEQLIADIFEQYTAESGDEIDYETFYNELQAVAEKPININTASKEDLEKLLFLNDIQIENILYYIYKFGALQTVYELQLIEGLDMTDIRRILAFTILETKEDDYPTLNKHDILKYGKSDLLLRMDFNIPLKSGYRINDNSSVNSKAYEGTPFYNSLRYKFHFKDRMYAGFTMEKDAGEAFFGGSNKTYDFLSAHIQLNKTGNFKTIVLGDYRASFGQGLVFGSSFGSGKSSLVTNVNSRSTGLKKYSSTNEYDFFRGVGCTVKLKKIDISAFVSAKKIDGDTTAGSIRSINKTGLHRTQSEVAKEKNATQTTFGLNSEYTGTYLRAGIVLAHTSLSELLSPEPSTYNQNYFRGRKQTSSSIYYRTRYDKFYFSGEMAVNQNMAIATNHSLSFSPHSLVNMVILYRYYSPAYDTFYAGSFSENTRINNETGVYTGIEIRPYRKWRISAYADSYRFPHARFNIQSPSWGRDYLLQADYQYSRTLHMFLRGKFEEKQEEFRSETAQIPTIFSNKTAMIRYQLNFAHGWVATKSMIEFRLNTGIQQSFGAAALQDISFAFKKIPLKIDLRYMMFDAIDYENRFYTYEKDILYAFAIPSFYGQGSRYYINMKYELNRNFSLWLKYAQTIYADERESIGTGHESASGNKRSDIRLLLKWNF